MFQNLNFSTDNILRYQKYLCDEDSQLFQLVTGLLSVFTGIIIGTYVLYLLPVNTSSLETARQLGIISRTILDGYPKHLEAPYFILGVTTSLVSAFLIFVAVTYYNFVTEGSESASKPDNMSPNQNEKLAVRMGLLRWIGLALLIFAVTFYREFIYSNWYWSDWGFSYEEGIYLRWINELLREKVLYKDIYFYGGPFLVWPQYWLMKIFGPSILLNRLYVYFCYFIGYIIVFSVFRQLVVKRILLLAGMIIVIYLYYPLLPGVQQSLGRFAVSLLPISFLYHFFFSKHRVYLLLAGISAAFALFFSQELGVGSFIAVGVMLATFCYRERDMKGFFCEGAVIGAGAVLLTVPVIAYFYFHDALPNLYEAMIITPGYYSLGAWGMPFPNPIGTLNKYDTVETLMAYWPIVFYIGSVFYCLALLLRRSFTNRIILFLGISALGGIMFQRAFGIYSLIKIKNIFYPMILLGVAYIDLMWSRKRSLAPERKQSGRKTELLIYASFVLFIFTGFYGYMQRGFWPGLRPHTSYFQSEKSAKNFLPVGISRAAHIKLPPEKAQNVRDVVNFIRNNASPDEPFYVFPFAPIYYFLADRDSPTRYPVMHGVLRTMREQAVEQLREKEVEYIVYVPRSAVLGVSTEERFPEIYSYIKNNYTVEKKFGDTEILRLKLKPVP